MGGKVVMKVMIIDITKCNGCFNCQIACKDEHVDNDWSPYAKPQPDTGHFWMHVDLVERGQYPKVKVAYVPKLCMHCGEVACMKDVPKGAIYRRDDGIVIVDPEKSKGQKQIVQACPYGCIYWNQELGTPQKCTFCAHLLDQGFIKEPRCVEACPTCALTFGEYDEFKCLITERKAEVLHPEFGLKPNVYYIGLPKRFVAGTVIFGDTDECAENVNVTLVGKGHKEAIKTNNYGDFEFEGLNADKDFTIKIEHSGYTSREVTVQTKTDVYLGEIVLTK
jgi:tetrathionate reductase subunit B